MKNKKQILYVCNEENNSLKKDKFQINYFKTYIITYISLLYIIIPNIFCSKININLRELNLDSEIIMKIKGAGEQYILNEYFYQRHKPDDIYVNNKSIKNNVIVNDLFGEENIIKLKWNYQLTACDYMFDGLNNIIEIDFSKFDTSLVEDMSHMFFNCSSLISLNLSCFNTSSVKNMDSMFYLCDSLEYLNLKNFDTSHVENMFAMFYHCTQLISLDLSNFNTII